MSKLLEVKNLKTYFYTDDGIAKAVDNVSYDLDKGETLGLVGESGCGKSVSALSIMRLIPDPPGKIVSGEILFKGQDLTKLTEKEMQGIRGNDVAMIFQEPMTSLNPVFTCGYQIDEAVILHQKVSKEEAEPVPRTTSKKQEKSTFEEVISSPVTKQIGRELVRGVFGVLFGTTTRRSTSRRKGGIF